ncbi:MAG: hypothetical protein SFV81_23250 [Pirellulaceae bacterium]|nr:hypothetical protein [Pirellulaceae bacterium]
MSDRTLIETLASIFWLATVITIGFMSPFVIATEPKFILEWGTAGDGPGQFHSPICIAVNKDDHVFVADLNNARVQQFTDKGDFVAQFELPRDTPDRKSSLIGGMAFTSDGFLCLSYMIQHKIAIVTQSGEIVRQWGSKGSGSGQFNQPGGIIIRSNGNIVVADQCNHRLQEFTSAGEHVRSIGQHGDKAGQFGSPELPGSRFGGPHFLGQDSQGRMYTSEGAAGRIQQLDSDGTPLKLWGSKTVEPGAFGEYKFGGLKNTFGPIGVFVDRNDQVWVSSLNDRVQCFSPEGQFRQRIDGVSLDDAFTHPHGMAQDSRGYFYVADSGGQRIVKFDIHSK